MNRQAKRRDQIVAIDLGGRSTKAVHLQRRGEFFSLVNYALMDAPVYEKSMSSEILADHLRNVRDSLGSGRTRQVTLAMSVTDTMFRQVEVPLMPVADLRQMLKFNSKNYLQQELPNHIFDCCYVISRTPARPAEGAKPGAAGNRCFTLPSAACSGCMPRASS